MHIYCPHTCYVPNPSYCPWFYHPNNTWWEVHVITFLVIQVINSFNRGTKQGDWNIFDVSFYLASSLIRGNKRPIRCNRLVFYCETYCLLNMFRAPLCPSSGALELYGWLLPVVLGGMLLEQYPANWTHNPQLHTRPTTCKPDSQVPQAAAICVTLELLMMGTMVPETCWANNKFCNKKPICLIKLVFYFHVLTTMHGQTHIESFKCSQS